MKRRKDQGRPRAKDDLRDLDVAPSKARGQNFAIDPSVILGCLEFAGPRPGENLVEIGPGLGALTAELMKSGPLAVVEIEPKFCERLRQLYPELKIHNADIRATDLSQFGSKLAIFGNVPYSFSTDIVFHLLKHHTVVDRAVLLLQKEFAERLAAKSGTKAYGSLSVAVQLWADLRLGPIIPGTAFHPPAKVESQFIELKFLAEPKVKTSDYAWLEKVVRASFVKKRKMLHNSLRAAGIWTGEEIDAALAAANIDSKRRAETLSLAEFAALAEALKPPDPKN